MMDKTTAHLADLRLFYHHPYILLTLTQEEKRLRKIPTSVPPVPRLQ